MDRKRASGRSGPDPAALIAALPHPLFAVGPDDGFLFANGAAEQFFSASGAVLRQKRLGDMPFARGALERMAARARESAVTFGDLALRLEGPEGEVRSVDVSVTPLGEGAVVVLLRERSVAERIGQPDTRREALRPVTGMAAMLAHEIKNPLSGIRGAAQLLARRVDADQQDLTELICEEVDRIASLVDRMDVFRQSMVLERGPVNIHEVLDRVRRLVQASHGGEIRFTERYDPSLPPVLGDRQVLVQVFLNLIKNACEAVGPGGEVTLVTAYRNDLARVGPEGTARAHLPLEVRIEDNGPGVPEDLRESLFEPFVTARAEGSGLGLAVVAKAVADHGAVVSCRSQPGRTVFATRWPLAGKTDETGKTGAPV